MLAYAYDGVLGKGPAPRRAAALVAARVVDGVRAASTEVACPAVVAADGGGAAPAVVADLLAVVLLEVCDDLSVGLPELEVLDDLVCQDAEDHYYDAQHHRCGDHHADDELPAFEDPVAFVYVTALMALPENVGSAFIKECSDAVAQPAAAATAAFCHFSFLFLFFFFVFSSEIRGREKLFSLIGLNLEPKQAFLCNSFIVNNSKDMVK